MFNLGQFEKLGRNEDDTIAHVATGEMVIRPELLGGTLTNQIKSKMKGFGLNPDRYTVGNKANSINPNTMQPEFGFFSDLFGSSGSGKELKKLENEFLPQIQDSRYATPGFSGPYGDYSIDKGGISLTPSEQATATSNMFQNLLPGLQSQAADNPYGQQLMGAYQAPTMDRQQLQNLFMSGLQPQFESLNRQADSELSQKFGSSGLNTGSASAMQNILNQRDLGKQQLTMNAYGGAQKSYLDEITSLQNMLGSSLGYQTQSLGNLSGAAQNQFTPYAGLSANLANVLQYGQNQTNFDVGKIGSAIDLRNQYAQYKTNPKQGFFQSTVLPTIAAFTGGNVSMPSGNANTGTATTSSQATNAMFGGGGGTSASSLYQPQSYPEYTSGMYF
jgi:hypothetical protein